MYVYLLLRWLSVICVVAIHEHIHSSIATTIPCVWRVGHAHVRLGFGSSWPNMAARRSPRRSVFRNAPQLQQFVLPNVWPTGRQLGHGSFGAVEELKVNGLWCAGKRIYDALVNEEDEGYENMVQKYVDECQLLSDMRHPNVVQFLGLCFLQDSSLPILVMELLMTSLDDLLERTPNIPLAIKKAMLADVARGLIYLHNRPHPVIHRDLSAKNVLLNSALVAKISDLGNSRIVFLQPGQLARTLSKVPGTLVYMPPEALYSPPGVDPSRSRYGVRIDIFSFGHLALFTITQVSDSAHDIQPCIARHVHTRLVRQSSLILHLTLKG